MTPHAELRCGAGEYFRHEREPIEDLFYEDSWFVIVKLGAVIDWIRDYSKGKHPYMERHIARWLWWQVVDQLDANHPWGERFKGHYNIAPLKAMAQIDDIGFEDRKLSKATGIPYYHVVRGWPLFAEPIGDFKRWMSTHSKIKPPPRQFKDWSTVGSWIKKNPQQQPKPIGEVA